MEVLKLYPRGWTVRWDFEVDFDRDVMPTLRTMKGAHYDFGTDEEGRSVLTFATREEAETFMGDPPDYAASFLACSPPMNCQTSSGTGRPCA